MKFFSKPSGWQRLLIVYAAVSAVVCFIAADNVRREQAIYVSHLQEAVQRNINADGKALPCNPMPNGLGCGQEVSSWTKSQIKILEENVKTLKFVLAKTFFLYWAAALFLGALITMTIRWVISGFGKDKRETVA